MLGQNSKQKNNMKSNKGGFTLIELLVVIAIIGILAAIVLVSLRGATSSAKNARIQSSLGQTRSIAAMIYDKDNAYTNLCAAGTINENNTSFQELATIEADLTAQYGASNNACFGNASDYCVSARLLPATETSHFCIKSDGKAGKATSACTGVTTGCTGL